MDPAYNRFQASGLRELEYAAVPLDPGFMMQHAYAIWHFPRRQRRLCFVSDCPSHSRKRWVRAVMVYKFDPVYFNGTVFDLTTWANMADGWMDYEVQNLPIPASYFPKSLTIERATSRLPDIFHTTRNIFVFSESAREVMEDWTPGQVEFIPVTFQAKPKLAAKLEFDRAYYFVNVLGRAQRLKWLEMPTFNLLPQDDGTEVFGLLQNFHKWKLRERAPGEPLIWHDVPRRNGNKEYRGHNEVLIEDVLWRELDRICGQRAYSIF